MLQLQANAAGDQDLSERLNEAASRVNAVGRAYERLAYTADYENIDLIEYLQQIINDLQATVAPCKIQFDAPEAIRFAWHTRQSFTGALGVYRPATRGGEHPGHWRAATSVSISFFHQGATDAGLRVGCGFFNAQPRQNANATIV
jgi:hypothetical protein